MKKLNELTIHEVLDGLKREEFTSVGITEACLERISNVDKKIKALITLNSENALEEAKKADEEIKNTGAVIFEKKPLLGIPYLCKDNFSVKGLVTTAGSNVLKNYISPYESTVTGKLKKAGAVL